MTARHHQLLLLLQSDTLHHTAKSLLHRQSRLGGDLDQLVDNNGRQYQGRQSVEDADWPHSDIREEHGDREAPVERRRCVTVPQIDDRHVFEGGDRRDGNQKESDKDALSVGGDASVEVETVMIPTIHTATTQSTVSTRRWPHHLSTVNFHFTKFTYTGAVTLIRQNDRRHCRKTERCNKVTDWLIGV